MNCKLQFIYFTNIFIWFSYFKNYQDYISFKSTGHFPFYKCPINVKRSVNKHQFADVNCSNSKLVNAPTYKRFTGHAPFRRPLFLCEHALCMCVHGGTIIHGSSTCCFLILMDIYIVEPVKYNELHTNTILFLHNCKHEYRSKSCLKSFCHNILQCISVFNFTYLFYEQFLR